jgi:transposase
MTDSKRPKILEADRRQLRLMPLDLEAAIAIDDPVRAVWAFAEQSDLSAYYAAIQSFEGELGRPATDPKILFALWIQATLDGVGSARELERLCRTDLRYQWICGGVAPNYHSLSDFRSNSADQFSAVLTNTVTVLLTEGLVELQRVAHDGMRVRASAGASSFRRGKRLKEMHAIASEQVERLREELDHDSGASKSRKEAAARRAVETRAKRIERALEQLPEVEKRKKSKNGKKKTQARVSTTDPDARVMKMADGGYRPAYNVQLATDTKGTVIVAANVTNDGTDLRSMVPLAEQVEERHGTRPPEWLADGGCVSLGSIEQMDKRGSKVFAPPKQRRSGRPANAPRHTDSQAIIDWRNRMQSDDGKRIYRQRGATAELVNAHFRERGLQRFLVRGLEKALSVVLLHAVTHNFKRMHALGAV